MYNEHFGLRQAPFRITPDTSLFYTGGARGDVLDALVYAITSGEGIVKVVGEVGTGKTMLCRMLEERLPDNVQIAYLANPSLTPDDILHAIALELGLDVPAGTTRLQVMHRLQETLLALHARNRRVVALVEEAQRMPVDTLEEIRLLSNLETKNDKLLQIVLFGQPELDDNLAQPGIRQLRERITHSFKLAPLARAEIKDYVAFRLRASGYRGRDAFRGDAYRAMSRASEGLTRRVNIIADKAMLAAFAENTHDVSARHVKVAIRDSEFDGATTRRARGVSKPAIAAAILCAAVLAGAAGWFLGQRGPALAVIASGPGDAPDSAQGEALHSPALAPDPDDGPSPAAAGGDAPPSSSVLAAASEPVPVSPAAGDNGVARPASDTAAQATMAPSAARAPAMAAQASAAPGIAGDAAPPTGATVPDREVAPATGTDQVAAAMPLAAPSASAPSASNPPVSQRPASRPPTSDAPPLAAAVDPLASSAATATTAAAPPSTPGTSPATTAAALPSTPGTPPADTPPRATPGTPPASAAVALPSTPGTPPADTPPRATPDLPPAAPAAPRTADAPPSTQDEPAVPPPAVAAAAPDAPRTADDPPSTQDVSAVPPPAVVAAAPDAPGEPRRELQASPPDPAPDAATVRAAPSQASAKRLRTAGDEQAPDLLESRLAHTRAWLAQVDPGHFSIQLLATDARQRANLETFLRRRRGAGDLDGLYVYETRINERPWFGVLYGEFDTVAEAREALRALPAELQRHAPFIRNIRDISSLG